MTLQSQFAIWFVLGLMTCSTHGFSKYGRTCADIGCPSTEVCVMAEDPCSYGRRDECGSYPTCQRRANTVKSCENFVCPPTMFCRLDGDTPKCIPDNGPLGGRNGNPNANVDPHNVHTPTNEHPSAPIYPQIPTRGQTTTRAPIYRPNNGGGGGYQGGSVGSGYPGQSGNGGGGGYGGGSIGGGYPGGYSGYPGTNNNRYPGYSNPSYPSSGGGYNNGYSNTNYPYNSNPYYTPNNNQQRYGHNAAPTTSNPLYDTLKNLGIFCFLLHSLIQVRQV